MKITPDQQAELLEAAKPLLRWLNENAHPHIKAIVDHTTVELVEGVATAKTDEFLKD